MIGVVEPPRVEPWTLRARWVVCGDGTVLRDGVITLHGQHVLRVESSNAHVDLDLGDSVVLPGLVNAHVHLEFSDLAVPIGQPGMPFPDWIGQVVAWKRSRSASPREAVSQGLCESLGWGVTTLGEIATGDTWRAPFDTPAHLVVFQEALALLRESIGDSLAQVDAFLQHAEPLWGISPHAPYTVHRDLLTQLVERAVQHERPLAMHLAETRDELQLLEHGTGRFRDRLAALGFDPRQLGDARLTCLRDYLEQLALAPRALVVHGNYLSDDEIAFIGQHRERLSVVYCPRTHAYFAHEPYPLRKLLAAGVRVVLGTDGRGSNPDLNVAREARLVHRQFPDVPVVDVLRMITRDGAEALGLAKPRGIISPGQRADLFAFPLAAEDRDRDPLVTFLERDTPPSFVLAAGWSVLKRLA